MAFGAALASTRQYDLGHAVTCALSDLEGSQLSVASPNHHGEGDMDYSLGNSSRFNRGELPANKRSSTSDCAAWLANFFRNVPVKVIANDAGINLRAAENVKQGRNGLTQAHLENLCNANPVFRAAWFKERCGGYLEGDPEKVAAISRAIAAVVREMS